MKCESFHSLTWKAVQHLMPDFTDVSLSQNYQKGQNVSGKILVYVMPYCNSLK